MNHFKIPITRELVKHADVASTSGKGFNGNGLRSTLLACKIVCGTLCNASLISTWQIFL